MTRRRPAIQHPFPDPVYLETVLKPVFEQAAKHLFQPLIEINLAHAEMLEQCGILKKLHSSKIRKALTRLCLDRDKLGSRGYAGEEEDLYFYVEKQLAGLCGADISGHLSVARSRNDVDIALYRMVLRSEILETSNRVRQLRSAVLSLAGRHLDSIFPVVTHTQPAQPSTMAHYLLAVCEFLERDQARLKHAFEITNQSPLGACVATTTGFSIDRTLMASLLGFDRVLENAYGCIAATDYVLEATGAIQTMMIHLGRVVQDFLVWSTPDSGLLRLPDGFVQCSSIMPQKRNPVALEHLRVLASLAVGHCQTVAAALHNTPFGDIVDAEDDLQPAVRSVFSYSSRVLELLTAVLETAEFQVEKARIKCQSGETTLTELADTLVRQHGLPFRTAHQITSRIAKRLRMSPQRRKGETPFEKISVLLEEISGSVTGDSLRIPPQQVERILDPVHFVKIRRIFGGPAPPTVKRSLKTRQRNLEQDRLWLAKRLKQMKQYQRKLFERGSRPRGDI
ncbi:MAG: argininosuccinate lyase [Acidobacteriota bacterium]